MLIDGEDVKQAIVQRLLELFPNTNVYKEAKSNVLYPHFFVRQVSLADEQDRREYHILSYAIEIRYRVASDPSTDLKLEQNLDSVALKLMQGFNVIDFEESKIRCTEKHYEKVDGVIYFFLNVDIMTKYISGKEYIKQGKLKTEVELKK